jgi:lysophospholipase L1-like esterase
MKIACYGDSLTRGFPGVSYIQRMRRMAPEHTILNYGRGGDTVLSLLYRIDRRDLVRPVDAAVLWVGVNDVLLRLSPLGSLSRRIMGQSPAQNEDVFRCCYAALLTLIAPHTPRLIAVLPLCIGEDLHNPWNQTLAGLGAIVKEEAERFANTHILDLRPAAAGILRGKPVAPYKPKDLLHMILDLFTLTTDAAVDRAAAKRGLHLTLDGVHLNTTGARLAATHILAALES